MAALPLFAYGTLQDADILSSVLGRPIAPGQFRAVVAPGHAAVFYDPAPYPALIRRCNAQAPGRLLSSLSSFDVAVLDGFEGDEYERRRIDVMAGDTWIEAEAYFPTRPVPDTAAPWSLEDWTALHKPRVLDGERLSAEEVRRRLLP